MEKLIATSATPSHHFESWRYQREIQEQQIEARKWKMPYRQDRISKLDIAVRAFGGLLKLVGLHWVGKKQAENFVLKQVELRFAQLPAAFDGFRLLHLTDLHLDTLPGMEDRVVELIGGLPCDACVWTGDYRRDTHGEYRHVLPGLAKIAQSIRAKEGIYSTLGNHDTWQMAEPLSQMGLRVLINESVEWERGGEKILVTGVDDPHYYYSMSASKALHTPKEGFKIALIHTPELYEEAAQQGYHLYLCGHTHGGQICLPNGRPLIKHLHRGGEYAQGLWHYRQMTGYTSTGCGVSGIPVRFFSQGEITLFTLRSTV